MIDTKPAAAADIEVLRRHALQAQADDVYYEVAPTAFLALIAELEQLRVGAPRWIACSDRMPESNDRHVLIRGERWTDCELGLLSRDEDGEFDGWECGEETSYYLSDITHWCPVPAFAAPALPEAVKP